MAQQPLMRTEPQEEHPFIQLKDIDLHYANNHLTFHALSQISFELYPRDFVCVLGPSGCGKSSLLNIIAGYERPSGGIVTCNGDIHTKPNPEIGVVFQHSNLFPWLTIEENVGFGLKMKGMPKTERKELVLSYLRMVGLESFGNLFPHQLSGGMKQRAAIARTLVTNPKVILMDEPFAALDALTREKMQCHLHELWKNTGKCIFFITHDVDEALFLSTRILVMKEKPGRIAENIINPLARTHVNQSFSQLRSTKEFAQMREYLISKISN
jgi:taurine transport system ATP-binding protein